MKTKKNLSILLSGQLISQVGDRFYLLALSYWILDSTGSATLMGLVLFATIFPETVIGLAAGAFVDKYNRKWIIVGTDFLRGLIVLFLAAMVWLDSLSITMIIAAQVLLSINAAFFNPAIPAVIPQIVEEENLTRANSLTQLVRGSSTVLGPVLGGLSVVAFGYFFVFLFNALSFLISAFFELFLTLPAAEKREKSQSLLMDIKEGLEFIANKRTLIILIISIAIIHFFVGSFQTITPVLALELTGNGAKNLGYLQTAYGVGMVAISSLFGLAGLLNKREVPALFGSVFLIGSVNLVIGVLMIAGFNQPTYHLPLFFLYGGFLITAVTSFRTLVQLQVPNAFAGRVFGVAFSIGDVSLPLAMLTYGFLLDRFSIGSLLSISGICLMICCLFLLRLFRVKEAPVAQQV